MNMTVLFLIAPYDVTELSFIWDSTIKQVHSAQVAMTYPISFLIFSLLHYFNRRDLQIEVGFCEGDRSTLLIFRGFLEYTMSNVNTI